MQRAAAKSGNFCVKQFLQVQLNLFDEGMESRRLSLQCEEFHFLAGEFSSAVSEAVFAERFSFYTLPIEKTSFAWQLSQYSPSLVKTQAE